jgi:tetratricopeptide (TPR) repeat protein
MPPEVIPMATPTGPPPRTRAEAAVGVLEKAVQAGCQDPNVLYMLALGYKRQGKTNEARAAFRKIQGPDANVFLQMGLLSLHEQQIAQAEEEFNRAWQMDPSSYPTVCNLLLTKLTLGKVAECLELLPRALELVGRNERIADAEDERRFLTTLQALLRCSQARDAPFGMDSTLAQLSPIEENRLLRVIRSLGHLETVHRLLEAFSEARPRSTSIREAYIEAVLVKGKALIDRCAWTEAELLLRPLSRERGISRSAQVGLWVLLGCCACMTQDFDSAVKHFLAAIKVSPNDCRLHQNLALTWELQGDLGQADPHWNRYFDLLGDEVPGPVDIPNYQEALSYEGLVRLANRYRDKEKWSSAVNYMQRACQLRANHPESLEQLFHLYVQAKRHPEARRTLDQLRKMRPEEPQYDLYELDLIEVKGLNDIERLLTEISRIRGTYPNDPRVEERATMMVSNVIPLMGNLCDQLTDQMSKVIDQVRHLPNYQINWGAVREVMRDLLREFQKLRRMTGKCLSLVSQEDQRRQVRDLAEHIDKKMEDCRSMGA